MNHHSMIRSPGTRDIIGGGWKNEYPNLSPGTVGGYADGAGAKMAQIQIHNFTQAAFLARSSEENYGVYFDRLANKRYLWVY